METVIIYASIWLLVNKKSISTVVFIQMSGIKTNQGTGGGLVFNELLAKSLIKKGIDVYAITNPFDLYGFEFLGERRYVAKFMGAVSFPLNWFIFNRKKLRDEISLIVAKLPEDSIYVTIDAFPPDIYAAKILKKLGKKIIITMYHITPSPIFHPIRRGVFRSLIAWLISLNALFFIKFFNVPFFLDNKRIAKKLGWNFKDNLMEMPLSLPKYFNIKNNELGKCVCFVGRLSKSKVISDLIKSWRIVVDKVPESRLYIIGADSSNGMYKRMIQKYKLQDSIIITGFLSYEEKMELMHKCSIFTFPSYEEGWALAVMEAIDMGLLPIVYDLPAYDYICTNQIKVKISDRRKLAFSTIHYLLNDNERLHLVEKLQNCILHYTEEVVINKWLDQVNKKFYRLI